MWVANHGEPSNVRNVGGAAHDGAAGSLYPCRDRIDVIGIDIADPTRRGAGIAGGLRHIHQTCDVDAPCSEERVGHAGHASVPCGPADDGAVEVRSSRGVGGHEFVPDEMTV